MNNGFNRVRIFFAIMVTIAWFASVIVVLLIPTRVIDPWVHLIAAALATALFGGAIWKRNGGAS